MARPQIYYPLDKDQKQIRLLRLHAPQDDKLTHAALEPISLLLDNRPSYEAISYHWGEVPGRAEIMLNGTPFFAPAAAVKVLHRFQPESGSRLLWIDAICINQSDVLERGQQVEIMGEIYESCSQALIWLGDHDEHVDAALESMKLVLNEIHERTAQQGYSFGHVVYSDSDPGVDAEGSRALIKAGFDDAALYKFMMRGWFTRLWVLQEATLSPSAICLCGDIYISWEDICKIWMWIAYKRHHICTRRPNGSTIAIMSFAPSTRVYFLEHFLSLGMILACSEKLDVVYAVLGLIERYILLDSKWLEQLRPDYTRSISNVFAIATKAAMDTSKRLSTLRYIRHQSLDEEDPAGAMWPSWVPRWYMASFQDSKALADHFNADDGRGLECTVLTQDESIERLVLQGIEIDFVSAVMPVLDGDNCQTRVDFRAFFNDVTAFIGGRDRITLEHQALTMITGATSKIFGEVNNAGPLDDVDFHEGLRKFLDASELEGETLNKQPKRNVLKQTEFDFATCAYAACFQKRVFQTERGFIGVGPVTMQANDLVTILSGGKVPYILRPTQLVLSDVETFESQTNSDRRRVRFVGECYVHDFMHGEAVREHEKSGKPLATFEII